MLEKGFVVEAARFVDIVQVSDTYIAKLVEATAKQDRQKAFAVHAMLARRNRSGKSMIHFCFCLVLQF